MAPALMATRHFSVVKQFQNVLKVKNRVPFRSISQLMCPVRTNFQSQLPLCGCGSPVGTVSPISYSAKVYSNKTLGMEYEDGKLIYFGAKAPLVKNIQLALYAVGAAIIVPSPYLWGIIEQEFARYILMAWVGLFGFMNPLMFYKFSQRYVIELYYNKENNSYTAVIPSIWVFGRRKIAFTSKDCSMPDSPTAFASFLVNKAPLLVSSDNMDYFQYSKMLRYASDFDYENPDRQTEYEETLQDAIREIGNKKTKKQSQDQNT